MGDGYTALGLREYRRGLVTIVVVIYMQSGRPVLPVFLRLPFCFLDVHRMDLQCLGNIPFPYLLMRFAVSS